MARLRLATTGTGIWQRCVGCPRRVLVSLPSIHAADSLGHGPDVNHGCRTFLCCPTHKKHLAGHRGPQFRKLGLLSKPGWRRNVSLTQLASATRSQMRITSFIEFPATCQTAFVNVFKSAVPKNLALLRKLGFVIFHFRFEEHLMRKIIYGAGPASMAISHGVTGRWIFCT